MASKKRRQIDEEDEEEEEVEDDDADEDYEDKGDEADEEEDEEYEDEDSEEEEEEDGGKGGDGGDEDESEDEVEPAIQQSRREVRQQHAEEKLGSMTETDEEYSFYIVAELDEAQLFSACKTYSIIGLDTSTPILQIDNTVFQGTYEDTTTIMLFEQKQQPLIQNPASDSTSNGATTNNSNSNTNANSNSNGTTTTTTTTSTNPNNNNNIINNNNRFALRGSKNILYPTVNTGYSCKSTKKLKFSKVVLQPKNGER